MYADNFSSQPTLRALIPGRVTPRLGDLGKLKLTPEQKAAILAAKQNAKVATVTAKAQEKLAKIQRKTRIRDARTETKIARTQANAAKYNTNAAIAQSDAQALSLPFVNDPSTGGTMTFSPGGGSGGGSVAAPESAPVGDDGTLFGLPPIAVIGAVGLVILFALKR